MKNICATQVVWWCVFSLYFLFWQPHKNYVHVIRGSVWHGASQRICRKLSPKCHQPSYHHLTEVRSQFCVVEFKCWTLILPEGWPHFVDLWRPDECKCISLLNMWFYWAEGFLQAHLAGGGDSPPPNPTKNVFPSHQKVFFKFSF